MEKTQISAKHLNLKPLCLRRSGQNILTDVEAVLPQPGVTVLLGANGAGKSSLLRVLADLDDIDSGTVDLSGISKCFLLPEPAAFYPQLTVREQLLFVAGLFKKAAIAVDEAVTTWHLSDQQHKLTKHLSLGFRQRLALAQLSVSDADLFLLDEPMNGMDPEVMAVFQKQVKMWKQHKTLVIATHVMQEVAYLVDWVVVLNQGRVIKSEAYDGHQNLNEVYQQAIQTWDLSQKNTDTHVA